MEIVLEALWISPGHDFKGRHGMGRLNHGMLPCDSIDLVAGRGISGDRYFDYKPDYKGQVTFFSSEVANELQVEFGMTKLDHSAFRRNGLVRGIDLNRLIGQRFRMGQVELSGSEECAPCYWMDEAIAPGAYPWLKGRGGLRCRIIKGGTLTLGACELSYLD